MKVTKELKAKIERAFEAKLNNLMAETDEARQKRVDALRADIAGEIAALPETSALRMALPFVGCYGKDDNVVETMARSYIRAQHDSSWKERQKLKDELELKKEDLLIALSYSADMTEIKSLFADHGIEW